ncbi:MAG: 50S ribosomal protein L1, partial [Candidatus Nanoarchaeia archaeon]
SAEGKFDELIMLPKGKGKNVKICALIGPELLEQAKKLCDKVILPDDFEKLSKTELKKIARTYDFFIAQANVMPLIAKVFGRYLSAKNKMPTPKLGNIVPPKTNLEPLVNNLRKSIRLTIKKSPVLQAAIGTEKMSDEDLTTNILAVLKNAETKLPDGKRNIKEIFLKQTMSPPIKISNG